MTAEQALTRLHAFLTDAETAKTTNVLVVADLEDEEVPTADEELVIQRVPLFDEVADEFLGIVRNASRVGDDTVIRPYQDGYKPNPHEWLALDMAKAPEIRSIVVDVSQVNEADQFEEDADVIDNLRAYAIVVDGPGTKRAVFFRSWSPKKELNRGKSLALMFQRGAYNKVRRPIFLFDKGVDCFAWEGFLFIRNVAAFRRIFSYFQALMEIADETIATVTKNVPIGNLEAFTEACKGHPLMLAKLSQIAKKPYLTKVTMKDIKRTIDEFNLGVAITDGQLVFDNARENRWKILNLLDDSYLGSTMTSLKYEVNSKVALQG